jgi:hypothetical protein
MSLVTVRLERVWTMVRRDLSYLKQQIEAILADPGER